MRVLKFGGKSLSSVEKINNIAQMISEQPDKKLVVVVSAMGDTTESLLALASELDAPEVKREHDMLLTTGERVSAALMSLALQKHGLKAASFTGSQAGILTRGPHSDADIIQVKPIRIEESLKQGIIPVVAGFQGVDPDAKDITTLGRGGTDLTAVAFAEYFGCCAELYKNVGGIYTCDPALDDKAQLIETLDFRFLNELSEWGAKIIFDKAAKWAWKKNVGLNFFSDDSFQKQTETQAACSKLQFSVTSLESIVTLKVSDCSISQGMNFLETSFREDKDASFKVLASVKDGSDSRFLIKSSEQEKKNILKWIDSVPSVTCLSDRLCAVSCVFSEPIEQSLVFSLLNQTREYNVTRLLNSSNRITFFIDLEQKDSFISTAHDHLAAELGNKEMG